MNINRKKINRKWFTYESDDGNAEFEVRPFPFSMFKTEINIENRSIDSTTTLEQFMYCLTNWRSLKEDGKPMVFDDKSKQYVYDYEDDIRSFIFEKANLIRESGDKELKN